MPEINVKSFNEIVETCEKMADGVKAHKAEEGFPSVIKEEALREMKTKIEGIRESYEQTLTKARQLQDDYRAEEKRISTELSRYKTMLYGFYGKKNQVVSNFGMKPFKGKGPTKKKSAQ